MGRRSDSFADLAQQFRQVARQIPKSIRGMSIMWAEHVEHDLEHNIIGSTSFNPPAPFAAWAPLAEKTIELKQEQGLGKGGNAYSMLYATGALSRSFHHQIVKNGAIVGTNDEKAEWLEYGTSKMPARPFVGPAGIRGIEAMLPRFERIMRDTIDGKPPF